MRILSMLKMKNVHFYFDFLGLCCHQLSYAEIGYDKESGSFEFADGLVWRTIPNIIWMVTHNEAEITREQFSLLLH